MHVAELLAPLEPRRVAALARSFAVDAPGLGPAQLTEKISQALDAAMGTGPLAERVLVEALSLEDCLRVLGAFECEALTPGRRVGGTVEEARADVLLLLQADDRARTKRPAPALGTERRRGLRVFQWAFVPLLLAAWASAWAARPVLERWFPASRTHLEPMSAVLLLSIVVIWAAEQVYPRNAAWNYQLLSGRAEGWRQLGRDLFYLFGVAQLSALLIRGIAPGLQRGAAVFAGHPHWPTGWPFVLRAGLAFLLVELFSYGLHRAAHRVPLLWRFHSTHHVITELNGLKALRTHPVDNLLFYLVRSVPLLLLGAGMEEVLLVTFLGATLSLLAHANVQVAEQGLGWLVNFPQFHAVHHALDAGEGQANFGCHTILWDRVFGTFVPSRGVERDIGVAPAGPRTLWQELVVPLEQGRESSRP